MESTSSSASSNCWSDLENESTKPFKLSFVYLMTFAEKITGGKRELIVRGNDLVLRKGRRLNDGDVPFICQFLHQHPEVMTLDLAYNNITGFGLMTLVDFLKTHDSLTRLNLMGNDIVDSPGIQSLANASENLPLETFRINGNKIGPEGGICLAKLLESCPKLQLLDVGDTNQTIRSLVYITTAMRSNDTLLMLDLSRPIGSWKYIFDKSHWAETVGEMLRFNTTLRELHLQKTGLCDPDIELLLLGMCNNRTLLLLDLGCNHVGNDGIKRLGDYLATKPSLLGLLLDHNIIGDDGALSLSFTLPFSRLQLLDLSHNQLTDEGLINLLNTIKKPIMLRALYIWGNSITQVSCNVIRRMLLSGVLNQDRFDIKVYRVDRVQYVAFNPVDRSRHLYYCVMDCGFPPPKKILPPRPMAIPTQLVCPRVPSPDRQNILSKVCPFGMAHPRLVGSPRFCK